MATTSPNPLDFGTVPTGTVVQAWVTLSHDALDGLSFCVDSIQYSFDTATGPADFAILEPAGDASPSCASIDSPLGVLVEFRPTVAGAHNATLEFVRDGIIVPNLSVSLRGVGQ